AAGGGAKAGARRHQARVVHAGAVPMRRARRAGAIAVGLALLALAIAAQAEGLRRAGRAEASLTWALDGLPGGAPRTLSGTLSLEPPALARLDVPGTGERITLRADGGEWLQPSLRQFVRLEPRHSVAALRWWRLLAGAGGASERKLGPRHFRLTVAPTPAG